MLKSVISFGFGRLVPGSIRHSLSMIANSRSGVGRPSIGLRGWTTNMPIMPKPIWVISSWWAWYMNVPCCRRVNS